MAPFKTLILLGRPASGKSEFIDCIKQVPAAERARDFHIGPFVELDDFVWLWEKFVEDDLWEAAGHARPFSRREEHGYALTDGVLLDFCLARFNAAHAQHANAETVFIEFARGAADGGYRHALARLSDDILRDAAVLFIYASYAEACRRNEARYQEKLKHSILAHKVPPTDMARFGKDIDWLELTRQQSQGNIAIRHWQLPFVTMSNEPEMTDPAALRQRYHAALAALYAEYSKTREALCA